MVIPSRPNQHVPVRRVSSAWVVTLSILAVLVWGFEYVNGAHRLGIATASTTSSLQKNSASHAPPAFSLLVTLQFSAAEYKDQFLEFFQPVAQHVREHEPNTLAYEVLLSDKDPLQVLVLERYRDKDVAYMQVHRSSAAFLEFRPKLQVLQEAGHVQISGHSYLDSGLGFGDRT